MLLYVSFTNLSDTTQKYKDKITNLAQIAVIQYRDIWTQERIRL